MKISIEVEDSGREPNPNYTPPASRAYYLNGLERRELEYAMLRHGVDYETVKLIIRDFHARVAEIIESSFKR